MEESVVAKPTSGRDGDLDPGLLVVYVPIELSKCSPKSPPVAVILWTPLILAFA